MSPANPSTDLVFDTDAGTVKRPRLRHKTEGEVKVAAYEMMRQDRGLSQHLLGALLRGISTREYQEVLPQMAATVGVSRSAISRKAIDASVEQLKALQERRWENVEFVVDYLDGQRFADHHILCGVGVDREGKERILGMGPGATENATSVSSGSLAASVVAQPLRDVMIFTP